MRDNNTDNNNASHSQGKLSLVATPIGNLEDVTYRAIRVLGECDHIICEDTRVTSRLLERYGLHKPLHIFHANSSDREIDKVISMLREGNHLCYVSDAGTPTISDPGVLIVNKIRAELPECIIESIPGASAVTMAYSLSGATGNNFTFYGFLPHKKGRETMIKGMLTNEMTSIAYESVHRIEKLLEQFAEQEKSLEIKREYVICRELTKMFEEVVMGDIDAVINYFKNNQDKIRGEFVFVVK